jgi:hypothetical protein
MATLTAQNIVTQACQIAKCPGFTLQAGTALNYILAELATNYNFDIIRKTTTIAVTGSSASYSLPADYFRAREVFYTVNGVPFYLNQIPLEEYDSLIQNTGGSSYPYSYATDPNSAVIFFYPNPTIAANITLRYMSLPADIATPETSSSIPWLPYSRYLIHAVATEMMKITDDTRFAEFWNAGEEMLKSYMKMDNDNQNYAQQVKLDRRHFKPAASSRATKLDPI